MKSKAPRHAQSLAEELTEPSLNGIRTQPRQKRSKEDDDNKAAGLPPELCTVIYDEAKQQREEIQAEIDTTNTTLPAGALFLAQSIKAAFTKIDGEVEEDVLLEDGTVKGDDFAEITDDEAKTITRFTAKQSADQPSFTDVVFEKIENLKKAKPKKGDEGHSGINPKIVKLYEGVGDLFSRYTIGKIPRAFRFVPNLCNWEDVIYLTRPDKWSPHAYLAVTKLFLNSNPRMAQRYMNRIMLPHLRQEIERKQKLHLALYEALKHTCHKPGAFYKGIIIPLCRSGHEAVEHQMHRMQSSGFLGTCTVREAVIFSSVIKRISLPVQHSAAALLCLAEMPYSGPTSFFIQTLLAKKYVLPFKALDGIVEHFARFENEERELPAIWHQSLFMFVQNYKQHLKQEDLADIRRLIKKQRHHFISTAIYREIDSELGKHEEKDVEMDDASDCM